MKYQKAIWEKRLPEIKSNRFKQTKNVREKENKLTNSLNNTQ